MLSKWLSYSSQKKKKKLHRHILNKYNYEPICWLEITHEYSCIMFALAEQAIAVRTAPRNIS